jgi:hypothetical protein
MNYCVINGKSYDVIVTSIEESFSILYTENTGRTTDGGMVLDPIGTYFTHKVTFKRCKENVKEFDDLYNFLTIPRYDGFDIEIVHNQTTIKYKCYVSQGTRTLQRIVERIKMVLWGELAVNFIPIEAQVKPE